MAIVAGFITCWKSTTAVCPTRITPKHHVVASNQENQIQALALSLLASFLPHHTSDSEPTNADPRKDVLAAREMKSRRANVNGEQNLERLAHGRMKLKRPLRNGTVRLGRSVKLCPEERQPLAKVTEFGGMACERVC